MALLRRSHYPPPLNWLRGRFANYVRSKILGPVFFSARWREQQKPALPGSRQPQDSWRCNLGAGRVHWQHASIHARGSRNNPVGQMQIKCFLALRVGVSWAALGTNVIGCPQLASGELGFILAHLLPYWFGGGARIWPLVLESGSTGLSALVSAVLHSPNYYCDKASGLVPKLIGQGVRLRAWNQICGGV